MRAPPNLIAVALLLTGCAAAAPGYTPPVKKSHFKAMESGTMTQEGGYQLADSEHKLDCKRLTGSMHIIVARLRDARDRAEPSQLAAQAHKTMAPLVGGSTAGADRQTVLGRERARLEAYNRQLAAKNCKTLDIEAELKRPAEPIGKRY